MMYIVCLECKHALRVTSVEPDEVSALFGPGSEYYPDNFTCHFCEERARGLSAIDAVTLQALEVHDVGPAEALAAMHGLGLPDERECSASAVASLLAGSTINAVKTRQIRNSHRCIIEHIELEDGTKVYLGASAHGALVYRVVKPSSYAARLDQKADHPGLPASS